MIDRAHDLPITRQAAALNISRGSVYYLPRPVSAADLAIMRRIVRTVDPWLAWTGRLCSAPLKNGSQRQRSDLAWRRLARGGCATPLPPKGPKISAAPS